MAANCHINCDQNSWAMDKKIDPSHVQHFFFSSYLSDGFFSSTHADVFAEIHNSKKMFLVIYLNAIT